MRTKILLTILPLALLTSCANSQGQTFGRNADAGALLGGLAGAIIGAHNGNVWKGAAIGAGAGLAAGAIADANDARQQPAQPLPPAPPPPASEIHSTDVVIREVPTVIVETPIIIDERIWVGNDVWIYSYRGFRGPNGHVRYESRIPFHRRFIHGGVGHRH